MVIDEKLLDELAQLEVGALLDALKDPELRANPSMLARVRNFLKDNKMLTQPETPGVAEIKKATMEIPDFDAERDGTLIQ